MRKLVFHIKWFVPCLLLAQTMAVARPSPQKPASGQKVRPIGIVTGIQPGQLTLHTDAGPNLTVSLPDGVSVLKVPPGAKSLKEATKITVSDIHMGDRVLIIGPVSEDQKSVNARSVIVMSKTDLAKVREEERLEWERNGVAGVVKSIDPTTKEITLAVPATHPTPGNLTHPVTVKVASNATLLRYAPNSVKFSDARPAPFSEIKVGDQLRALGAKSQNGTHLTAEKVVSGTFRNIGATVISVDAAQGTLTVKDLSNGQPVVVHTNTESRLHELTPQVADTIAMFNAGTPGKPGEGRPGAAGGHEQQHPAAFQGHGRPGANGKEGGVPGVRSMDFDQMLKRMPPLSLNDLKAGEPLIVVSTEGARPGQVTAIAVLSGVEPILRARPKGSKEVALGPWNMSVGGGGGGGSEGGGEGGP